MGTITTTTVLDSLRYQNDSMIEGDGIGNLYCLKRTSSTQLDLFVSTNGGTSWSIFAGGVITRANLQETSGIFIDSYYNVHLLYRTYESGEDRIYYRRIESVDSVWEPEQLIASATAASAGAVYTGMSCIAFLLSSTWYITAAIGTRNGVNSGVTLCSATISRYSGYFQLRNTLISGTRQWLNGPDGIVHPAIDFRHAGDAKTPQYSPSIWVTWGRTDIYVARLGYTSGPSWSGPTTPAKVGTASFNQDSNQGRYNAYGDKFNVCWPGGSVIHVVECNVSNTGFTYRDTPAHLQGSTKNVAISNNAYSNSYRLWAVGTTTPDLYYIDWQSNLNAWGNWNIITTSDIVGTTPNNYSVRRNTFWSAQFDLVIATGTSPYTLSSTSTTLPSPPNVPTLITPKNGWAYDVNAALLVSWTFGDVDPTDTQAAYAIKRVIGASTTYWNNATASWQASEVYNTSSVTSKSLPSGWGADGDTAHSYSVSVQDSGGLYSDYYSVSASIIPSAKDNPTITYPTTTTDTPNPTITWTVATQNARKLEILDAGGNVVFNSGDENSLSPTYQLTNFNLQNSTTYTLRLTTRNDEWLASDPITQSFTTAFTPPAAATTSYSPLTALGIIRSSILNPDASGTAPEAATNILMRREVGDTGPGVKVADLTRSGSNNRLFNYNPDFELALGNWGPQTPSRSTATRVTTQFKNGLASLEQNAVDGSGFSGIFRGPLTDHPIVPGDTATMTFWFKGQTAGRLHYGVLLWRKSDTTGNGQVTGATVAATGAWQQVTVTGVAPALTAYVVPSFDRSDTANVVGEKSWLDTVTLVINNAQPAPVVYDDFTVASGVTYEYSVVTRGANGSVSQSAWTS